MSYYIDSHCHLHDRQFFSEEEAEKVLARCREMGVEKIVCIGTDPEDSMVACRFAEAHPGVYWTYGVHPEEWTTVDKIASLGPRSAGPSILRVVRVPRGGLPRAAAATSRAAALRIPSIKPFLATPPVAIGEVGLDYHSEGHDREAQIRLFEEMLQLAQDNDLPLSFHVRNAFSDFFPVVANFPGVRGVVHSFTDSKKVLRRILETTDFYVGVNGLATYSTLPTPPLERILLETDAPFLAPVPHRGEKNDPSYIPDVAAWLAGKLEVDIDVVRDVTTRNTEKLFGI